MASTDPTLHSCNHCQKLIVEPTGAVHNVFDFTYAGVVDAAAGNCLFCRWILANIDLEDIKKMVG